MLDTDTPGVSELHLHLDITPWKKVSRHAGDTSHMEVIWKQTTELDVLRAILDSVWFIRSSTHVPKKKNVC